MSHRSRTASPMPSSKPFSAICPQIDHLQREQAERQAVRTSLTEWARLALSQVGHQPALHHALLLRELEALTRGSIDRLMVLMPPGSAKSTYASVLFPAWWFVQHPSSGVIATSHTADLAEHFGRQVRNLIVEHGPRLGYSLKSDNRSAGRWQISTRGEYFAAGVRGPITGRRADLAIIDDPIKSHAEADSPSYRDHVWNWYRTELMTRLKPGGRVVLIMTRWHEDDLGGRLLASEAAEWRALRLPALAEENDPLGRVPGAPLWPEWEDAAALRRKRSAVGERVWSALFQQTPRPPTGALFKVSQVSLADDLPGCGRSVRAWDIAATAERDASDPDWTVGLKLHRDEAGRFTVLDVIRLRGTVHEVNQTVARTAREDGVGVTIGIPQDPGSAGKFMVQQFATLLAGYHLVCSPETGAKITRARPISAQIEAGNFSVLRSSWTAAFVEELRDFPLGRKDDQVDALSRAFSMLTDAAVPARRVNVPLLAR